MSAIKIKFDVFVTAFQIKLVTYLEIIIVTQKLIDYVNILCDNDFLNKL